MRIRQIKPEFWQDPEVSRLSDAARLYYIGLWNLADDAGYLVWHPEQVAAMLEMYRDPKRRVKKINKAVEELRLAGNVLVLDCGHLVIPTLTRHQRLSGTTRRVETEKTRHDAGKCPNNPDESRASPHIPAVPRTSPHIPDPVKEQVKVGNGTVGKGTLDAHARDEKTDPRTRPVRYVDGEGWVYVEGAVL